MVNKVLLIGNVGADPEIRTLEGGLKVARLRIATTEKIYNRQTQESRDHTEWHTVTLWRNLADVADRFIRKGSQVYIEGRIRSRDWVDSNNVKRYGIEIVADEMKMLGRKQDGAGAPSDGTYQAPRKQQPDQQPFSNYNEHQGQVPQNSAEEIDDLPF